MEDVRVHAVVGHVEVPGVAGDEPEGLVTGRRGWDDQGVRATYRPPDRGSEETLLELGVRLGVGEEGGVMEGDDDRHPVTQAAAAP